MNIGTSIVQLASAVVALVLGAAFVGMYSEVAYVRLVFEVREPDLSSVCAALRDHGRLLWGMPLAALALGAALIVRRAAVPLLILCHVSWLVAAFWVCLALVAWEIVFVPARRPLAGPAVERVPPYSNNANERLVKTRKLCFLDMDARAYDRRQTSTLRLPFREDYANDRESLEPRTH